MTNPYELDEPAFKAELAVKTTPAQLLAQAPRVYEYLGELFGTDCNDSVLREWSFQWWADQTGQDYEVIYSAWLWLGLSSH